MISPLMETPPKWHGLVAWVFACLVASSLFVAAMIADSVITSRKMALPFSDLSGYLGAWMVSTFFGMVLVAAPSILLVMAIRHFRWRRGLADILAGFLLGFAFPMLTLILPGPRSPKVLVAAIIMGLLGAVTGFCYWAVARWLAGRWVKRERQRELDVF